ncbi:MAG: hypothetical protein PHS49_03660 [Candidatus Gracilibacteria bacterium]|nr:hypothetical protein [Candidatus Gracilibacteria bacterium]
MIDFNKIVQRLGTKCGKVIFKDDIFEIIDPEKKEIYADKLDKYIYKLKALGVIINLKAGVYIVPDIDDKKLNKIDLIDKYYLKLLKKYITHYVGASYYISGRKSLEFHMKNFEIPEKIFIVNRTISKKIMIGNLEIIFKTISGNDNAGKKINLFSKFSAYTVIKTIDSLEFKISGLELALVEAALVNDTELGVPVELLSKTIKKYSKVMNNDIFYDIGKYKFIMSFNRLKEIAKPIDTKLYEVFLDIIKKNGGLFIGEGVRGI